MSIPKKALKAKNFVMSYEHNFGGMYETFYVNAAGALGLEHTSSIW